MSRRTIRDTYTRLSGTTRVSRYQKGKTNLNSKQETVSTGFQFAIRIDSIRYANRFVSIRFVKKIGLSIHELSCSFSC